MLLLNKIYKKILYLVKIYSTRILYKYRFFYLGDNTIIDPRLSMYQNLQYVSLGKNVRLRYGWRIEAITDDKSLKQKPLIEIGEGTKFEVFIHIGASNHISIGKNCLIASNVYITDHNHIFSDFTSPIRNQGVTSSGKVIIADNVWIGRNVVILPNVKIGKNSVIAANAVVTKDVPPNTVAMGVPAINKVKV